MIDISNIGGLIAHDYRRSNTAFSNNDKRDEGALNDDEGVQNHIVHPPMPKTPIFRLHTISIRLKRLLQGTRINRRYAYQDESLETHKTDGDAMSTLRQRHQKLGVLRIYQNDNTAGYDCLTTLLYFFGRLGAIALGASTAIILHDYNRTHHLQTGHHAFYPSWEGNHPIDMYFGIIHLLTKSRDVRPTIFLLALCGYGLSSMVYCMFSKNEHFQDAFIFGGVVTSVGFALTLGSDFQTTLLSILPGFLLLSLILSTFCHQFGITGPPLLTIQGPPKSGLAVLHNEQPDVDRS